MNAILFSLAMSILPPCPAEDSGWCHWNAAERGNGQGESFFVLGQNLVIYEKES